MKEKVVLFLLFAVWPGFWGFIGHSMGSSAAEAEGRAALQSLQGEWSAEKVQDALAFGKAVSTQLENYEAEVDSGNKLSAALAVEKTNNAKLAAQLRKRVPAITRGGTSVFDSGAVRVWNEATGAFIPSDPLPETLCPAGTDERAGACAASGSGVHGMNETGGVSETDALNYTIYYGERCKGIEKQLRGWQRLAKERGWVPQNYLK